MDDNTMEEIPSPDDKLVFIARFPSSEPAVVFDYWTDPTLLCRWWPQEAEIDPQMGGAYHLAWPQMDWHLRGTFTAFAPGEALGFTWHWDHEPAAPVRHVQITLARNATGCDLTLVHTAYGSSAQEQKVRNEEHRPGWQHFLPRLQTTVRRG
jgi:uncharacterized protein YndB with AHSA1/START domain